MQTILDSSKNENWKQAHKRAILNESFVEVSLNIADPDALDKAVPQDNGAIYISNSSDIANGDDKTPSPYCTLEQNIWCLDGTRKAIPESAFGDNGYVSDVLSDDTCIFSTKQPVITISFQGEVFAGKRRKRYKPARSYYKKVIQSHNCVQTPKYKQVPE